MTTYDVTEITCDTCNNVFKVTNRGDEPLPTTCLICKAKRVLTSEIKPKFSVLETTCDTCKETFKVRLRLNGVVPTVCPKCKIKSDVKTMRTNCADCNTEFESVIYKLAGQEKPLSNLCYDCRNKKRDAEAKEDKERQELQLQSLRDGWLKCSGIPEKFKNESLATFQDRGFNTVETLKRCQDYVKGFSSISTKKYKSMVLVSPNNWGVGKSHLACGIGKGLIDKWLSRRPQSPICYATEQDMLRRVRATFNRDNLEHEDQVFQHLTNVPLLLIDDMGKEEVSDPRFVQRFWFSVVNGRYENELPIVITANLNADGIATYLGGGRGNEATFDRLLEMTGGIFWEVQGKSKRREYKR